MPKARETSGCHAPDVAHSADGYVHSAYGKAADGSAVRSASVCPSPLIPVTRVLPGHSAFGFWLRQTPLTPSPRGVRVPESEGVPWARGARPSKGIHMKSAARWGHRALPDVTTEVLFTIVLEPGIVACVGAAASEGN